MPRRNGKARNSSPSATGKSTVNGALLWVTRKRRHRVGTKIKASHKALKEQG